MQLKYTYDMDQETRKVKIIKGYEDMRKCNYYIAKNYSVHYNVKSLGTFTVAEANISYQASLLNDLKLDFLLYSDNFDLEIYNWDAIISYINKCVDTCLKEVRLVMESNAPSSPVPYMIPIRPIL